MSHLQEDKESPLWELVRAALMFLLFVPAWAGMNFAFGTALDGPIGVFVMETPCQRLVQRLGGTPERLDRYVLGKSAGRGRSSPSICHFASRSVRVGDGPTDGLGFTEREFAYLAIGFAGYAACFAGAAVLAFVVVRAGWKFIGRNRRARKPSGN